MITVKTFISGVIFTAITLGLLEIGYSAGYAAMQSQCGDIIAGALPPPLMVIAEGR